MSPPRTAIGLRRDLELLEVLRSPEATWGAGLSVTRIAELTGREKSQVSRALAGMREEGLVDRDPETLAYRCGWRLYALAAATGESRLVHTASPFLRRLVSQVRETTHLCVLRGLSVMTLLTEASPHAFRSLGWEGSVMFASQTSAGRVLISDWDDAAVRASFTDESLQRAPRTQRLRSVDALIDELHRIRATGYAKVEDELEEGLVGVSAPVRDFRGRLVAAVNIGAPSSRLQHQLDAAGRLTVRCAAQLSHALGYASASRLHPADQAEEASTPQR
ncbi:IclR family transcriptional regulator [Streptomyces formicae]|uniref:IclR family transcriptional regulator n=1 Tax=Streptomyces formicae TaxID=1616117 RepID=A0ABY3WKN6_9ACTN|nr:IclR family transcriptional regulator [Streptomyces formicae]UNM12255.1 IclR family transcriptional regulator [Streptomyces formicae]